MAKVKKETADAHKRALAETAGRLFREKGIDAVGVAEIAKAAGLTHGAIYSGFGSKRELAAGALATGRKASQDRLRKAVGEFPDITAILSYYVSRRQRDDRVRCCPLVASASEASRQDEAYRELFSGGYLDLVSAVEDALRRNGSRDARQYALAISAGMIGAVAIARVLDRKTSDELLDAACASFSDLAKRHRR